MWKCSKQIAQARGRMLEINQQREGLQAKVREREKAIEAGRQVILRLLGEASTLKNQLAQIEEYLAGIDRETARSTREEQVAAGEIERLETARKQLSETQAQRQMELEAVTGERAAPNRNWRCGAAARWSCAARSTG
jgi:chromosome segregation ATPase